MTSTSDNVAANLPHARPEPDIAESVEAAGPVGNPAIIGLPTFLVRQSPVGF
jgi:hypothetical protein